MTIRTTSKILLVSAAIGAAGCSADATRFGDFYANAVPGAPGTSVDQTATGSIAPNQQQFASRGVAPGQTLSPQPVQQNGAYPQTPTAQALPVPGTTQQVQRPQLAALEPQRPGPVARMANGVRNLLPRRDAQPASLPRASAQQPRPLEPAVATNRPALQTEPSANPVQAAAETPSSTIKVEAGDTLLAIAKRYGTTVDELVKANALENANALRAGQELTVPAYAPDARAPVEVAAARVEAAPALVEPVAAGSDPSETTVKKGDTLFAIARRHDVTVDDLRRTNDLPTDSVRIGQVLRIPSAKSQLAAAAAKVKQPAQPVVDAAAQPAKTASLKVREVPLYVKKPRVEAAPVDAKVERSTSKPVKETAKAEPKGELIKAPESTDAAQSAAASGDGLRWPVKGRIIRGFGNGSTGLDIAAPTGSEIRAAEAGTVIYAGSGLKEYGKTVLIKHADGLVTVYGHADSISVAKGQSVKRGDVIAASGKTGQADTPRVHFQVRKGQAPVDPATYLR